MQSHITHQSRSGKSLEDSFFRTLPYDSFRVAGVCGHSNLYVMQNYPEQPPFCGLCFFREGYDAEAPRHIHIRSTLAENGNPESSPEFMAHFFLSTGLVLPGLDKNGHPEPLHEFRRKRGVLKCNRNCEPNCLKHRPRAREQYTEAAWKRYPVASAIWKLMGYQPPLGIALVRGVQGRTEPEIAKELAVSVVNVHIRMVKAIRTAMGYLPNDEATAERSSRTSQTEPEWEPGAAN